MIRLVTSLLIFSIVPCPLWCDSDTCCADDGLFFESSFQACPLDCTASCDCEEPATGSDHRAPCPCPNKSCQGVCGGAVIAKPIELSDNLESHSLPLNVVFTSSADNWIVFRAIGHEQYRHGSSDSFGRMLRTSHMSLLL